MARAPWLILLYLIYCQFNCCLPRSLNTNHSAKQDNATLVAQRPSTGTSEDKATATLGRRRVEQDQRPRDIRTAPRLQPRLRKALMVIERLTGKALRVGIEKAMRNAEPRLAAYQEELVGISSSLRSCQMVFPPISHASTIHGKRLLADSRWPSGLEKPSVRYSSVLWPGELLYLTFSSLFIPVSRSTDNQISTTCQPRHPIYI
ncbi:hypothetical protein C8J56DRAFT_957764 [Mycena floridula]|nr:hypothetical protein C8J56DRAFT_957764 [Mycena floridula]